MSTRISTGRRTCRRLLIVAATGLLATLGITPQKADALASAVTVDSNAPEFWQGEVRKDGRTYDHVAACRITGCDRVRLNIKVPSALRKTPGGIEVSTRWLNATLDDSLGLYAYQGRTLVASSTGQIGTAQSLLLPKKDATYDIYVSLQPLDPSLGSDAVQYEGLAENEDKPPVRPVRDLLPDLKVLPQRSATFETPPPIFDDSAPAGSSCFRSEIQEQGARLCLRAGQAAANIGAGAIDVRYSTDAVTPEQEVDAVQRIYRSDGSHRDRSAGTMHWHPAHNHYHFEGFSVSSLYALGSDGDPVSTTPVASGKKNGFCMADTELPWWGLKGNAPQSYPAPRCLDPIGEQDGRKLYKNGIGRGWADEYAWVLPDQMIEVHDVTDGLYLLVTRVDPDGKVLESDETNNCIATKVELKDLGTSTPTATLVGTAQPCS